MWNPLIMSAYAGIGSLLLFILTALPFAIGEGNYAPLGPIQASIEMARIGETELPVMRLTNQGPGTIYCGGSSPSAPTYQLKRRTEFGAWLDAPFGYCDLGHAMQKLEPNQSVYLSDYPIHPDWKAGISLWAQPTFDSIHRTVWGPGE